MEDNEQRSEAAEGSDGTELSNARRMQDRRRSRLDEPLRVEAPLAGEELQGPHAPFAALLLALQRQDEMRELARQRADLVASFGCDPSRRAPQDEWRRLWDDMEREAHVPKRGWEPEAGGADPASPEASPEIADWERHWPSQAARVDECGSSGGRDVDGRDRREGADRRVASKSIGLFGWLARIVLIVVPRGRR